VTRFRLDLAYDGTAYAGFQLQGTQPTIQLRLEEAIASVTGHFARVQPSGRTDAGVHARGQVAHFDSPTGLPAADLHRALNAVLPPDIRVDRVRVARPDFHARFDAVRKEYRYFIWNHRVFEPFHRPFRLHEPRPLAVEAMAAAAARLRGRHDFASFTANPRREVGDTTRTLQRLDLRRTGPLIVLTAVADGFLYKMVRSLAGFLLAVGGGKFPPEAADALLRARRRNAQVPTAPPQGLFLWRVGYGRPGQAGEGNARAGEE
jgi:tRNA pseudouridine38-40 synthase